ncbi:hypothetical protein B0H19DRAFT_970611, partial [Mycena capillaripes]
ILSWTGDNASSNDTQTTAMSDIPTNSFNKRNRVRCFAHTLNLVAKSILRPFSAPEKKKKTGEDNGGDNDTDSLPDLVSVSDSDSFDGAFDDDDEEMDSAEEEDTSSNVEDELDLDERAALEEEEQKAFDAETRIVKKSLDKVCAPP